MPPKDLQSSFVESTENIRKVSCAKVSRDLRPCLEAIDEEIARRRVSGKPVVILMSEAHGTATHAALRQALMERLVNAQHISPDKIGYGSEINHTLLKELTGDDQPDHDGKKFLSEASNSQLSLTVSRRSFLLSCQELGVSYRNNDTGKLDAKNLIDLNDPKTRDYIHTAFPQLADKKEISLLTAEGMKVRNGFIVEQIKHHIADNDLDYYVQDCGFRHLAGITSTGKRDPKMPGVNEKCAYKDSLDARLIAQGFEVVTVIITTPDCKKEDIPKNAWPALRDHGLLIEGLDSTIFYSYEHPGHESNFFSKINRLSGGEAFKVNVPDDPFPAENLEYAWWR